MASKASDVERLCQLGALCIGPKSSGKKFNQRHHPFPDSYSDDSDVEGLGSSADFSTQKELNQDTLFKQRTGTTMENKSNFQMAKERHEALEEVKRLQKENEELRQKFKPGNLYLHMEEQNIKRVEYEDGMVWEGRLKNGLIEGRGKLFGKNEHGQLQLEIEGEFKNGQLHGQGTEYAEDGSVHTGTYLNGMRQGYGVINYGSGRRKGDKYEGNFVNDFFSGPGKYTFSDGRVVEGIFSGGDFPKDSLISE